LNIVVELCQGSIFIVNEEKPKLPLIKSQKVKLLFNKIEPLIDGSLLYCSLLEIAALCQTTPFVPLVDINMSNDKILIAKAMEQFL
jgi:hypothetical protein